MVLRIVFFIFLSLLPGASLAETQEERRARLEAELATIEADINAKRGDLTVLQKERTSLERDIAILDTKIDAASFPSSSATLRSRASLTI